MIWILLVLLTVVGGATAVGIAVRDGKGRKQIGGKPQLSLPSVGDNLIERTVREMRINDILTIDGRDFLVEGMLSYDEDGHRWTAGRVVDNKDIRWLVIGIERAGAGATRLMTLDEATQITGYPPEAIVVGEVRFALDKRGAATCKFEGDVGALGGMTKDRPDAHVERCRWWLYSAPGDDTLLVEQFGADYRVLRGKKIVDGTIELMPGS